MNLHDLIQDLPIECTKNRHSAAFRTPEDYQLMYPRLSKEQSLSMYERMAETYPGTHQRQRVVDYFANLEQTSSVEPG